MKKFVIYDLEATCYDKKEKAPLDFCNEIIEIGAVMLDVDGNEISQFSKFARPVEFPILSDFCKTLTSIRQEDIDSAASLKDVISDFMQWSDNATFISWGFYDRTQLEKDMIRNDLEHLLDRMEDHYSLKHLHGKWNNLKRSGIGLAGAMRIENYRCLVHIIVQYVML